jgi:hypothetical protein
MVINENDDMVIVEKKSGDSMNTFEPQQIQSVYADFKKIVDKYFSAETFSEKLFNNSDMANAIEEMSTVCQRFAREQQQKENQNENT